MSNRLLLIIGIPLYIFGIPLSFFFIIKDIYAIFFYKPEMVELTSTFGVIPLLSWFWLLGIGGLICLLFKIKPKWSGKQNKWLGTYIPCVLAVVGIILGTLGKKAIADYLLGNNYHKYKVEKITTSLHFKIDKDIFIRKNPIK
ncbi:MAG: hypothetical protein ACK5NC_07650 [Vibrio sp.]